MKSTIATRMHRSAAVVVLATAALLQRRLVESVDWRASDAKRSSNDRQQHDFIQQQSYWTTAFHHHLVHSAKRSIHVTQLEAKSPSPHLISPTFASSQRTWKTPEDLYYQTHKALPPPANAHFTLPPRDALLPKDPINKNDQTDKERQGILIIGDVHGCFDELILLHEKAVQQTNEGREFEYVILVGDLVNKGPASLEVIRHVQNQPRWLSIRGNHDDSALLAALGDPSRREKSTYQWIFSSSNTLSAPTESKNERYMETRLTDQDVQWMADLPYTIRIPKNWFHVAEEATKNAQPPSEFNEEDVLIVHAGLVPGIPLEQQSIQTMITIRTLQPVPASDKDACTFSWRPSQTSEEESNGSPWASSWKGPDHVVFGHDARRSLQLYSHATGLDTGAVYGKRLTGLVLPQHEIVSVPALDVHCPIS